MNVSLSPPPRRVVGLLLVLAFFVQFLPAQIVDLPLSHEAYDFLERMEAKGYLGQFRNGVKPLPRREVARHLLGLQRHVPTLTAYEIEELAFLTGEFGAEMHSLRPDSLADVDRWRPVSFEIHDGILNLSPNLLVQARRSEGKGADQGQIGFQAFGHVFGKLGYYFNFISRRESGALAGLPSRLSPEQGVSYFTGPAGSGGYDYNFTDAALSYDFGDFWIAVEKSNNAWGEERFGNLILSTKPPSYPKLKFRASLADWLDFTYIHADLHSGILDSSRSYFAGTSTARKFFREVYREKYLAAHVLEFSPWPWVDLMLGESVVYSDRGPQLIFLLPVMFFKSGEHYNRDTDNTQFFGSLDLRVASGVSVYGSMLIDELAFYNSPSDPVSSRNQLGYAAGLRLYDLPVSRVELFAEYTRLNPWVYSHKFGAVTFTNNGFPLGHWIDQNADLASVEVVYRPVRAARVSLSYQSFRKGDTVDVVQQYSPPAEEFLFGRRRTESSIVASVQYQFARDAFVVAEYRLSTLSNEQTPSASYADRGEFLVRLRYGLW